jgi:N-acetylneuraminic acid mutarotase
VCYENLYDLQVMSVPILKPRPINDAEKFSTHTLEWYFVEQGYTPARHGHSAVAYLDSIYVFGGDGKDDRRLNAIHKFDVETLLWTKIIATGTQPEPRCGHSAVVWRDVMIIFGGRDGRSHFGDLYALHFRDSSWQKIETTGALVKRRYRHSAVAYGNFMYIFGGETGGEGTAVYGDFYEFDILNKCWREIQTAGTKPSARSGHTAVVFKGNMYLFGGRNKTPQYFRDLHRYHFASKTWSLVETNGVLPPRIYNHSAFTYRESLYIFGGYGIQGDENKDARVGHRHSEVYEYSFDQSTWSMVKVTGTPPSARLGHTTAVVKSTLYLFGGWDRNGYRSDLYCINFDDVMLDMKKLFLNPRGSDICFVIQPASGDSVSILAHRSIIAVRCPKLMSFVDQQIESLKPKTEKERDKEREKEKDFEMITSKKRDEKEKERGKEREKKDKKVKEKEKENSRRSRGSFYKRFESPLGSEITDLSDGIPSSSQPQLSLPQQLQTQSTLSSTRIVVVVVENVQANVFRQLLEYVYTDTMTYDPEIGWCFYVEGRGGGGGKEEEREGGRGGGEGGESRRRREGGRERWG